MPRVDYQACLGDRECVEFCPHQVFDWDEALDRPAVSRPNNCVVGCDACSQICPAGALAFPSKDELRSVMRRLISEAY